PGRRAAGAYPGLAARPVRRRARDGGDQIMTAALLARARAAAERLMVDECVIRRRVGETTGPGGVVTPVYEQRYAGRCRVQQPTMLAQPQRPGEAQVLALRLEVHVPMAVTGVQVGDEVEVTSSAHDPDLVGRVLIVHDLAHKTQATARRLGVVERT